MKKSTAIVLLYFATLLLVAILTSCQRTVVRKPNPCPSFGKSHPRDMPYMHYNP